MAYNKYRVAPKSDRTYNGVLYASKAEAIRAQELDLLVRAGHVIEWERQPRYELGVLENVYHPDFLVTPAEGEPWAEEIKGYDKGGAHSMWWRNRALWKVYGPCELRILKRKGSGWTTEIVSPAEKEKP